jgi:hypothetical protein
MIKSYEFAHELIQNAENEQMVKPAKDNKTDTKVIRHSPDFYNHMNNMFLSL